VTLERRRPMSRNEQGPSSPEQQSHLAELVDCERELAELQEAAEASAERMVAEARAASAAAEAEVEGTLEDEAARLRTEIREAAQRRVREVQADAEDKATSFDRVTDEEVARLAEIAFLRLLAVEVES
jgi:hypothetical protein